MMEILFLDGNAIWHQRFAEALAEEAHVTVINPRVGWIPSIHPAQHHEASKITVTLPRGWASTTAFVGQRILALFIARFARKLKSPPVIVLTSPAYAPLAMMLKGRFPLVSYTADDYRNYDGWGGPDVVKSERFICRNSTLSIFVSETLRQRGIREFNLDPERTTVSPNATERRFAARHRKKPDLLKRKPAPVVGVLGGLSDRLDLEALAEAASSRSIKTFLVAGPASWEVLERYPVFSSEKVVITGRVPHEDMHLYAAAMDVAIIPYAKSELNRHCSPMRLYDHLATGIPIVALEGCDQIDRGEFPALTVVRSKDLAVAIQSTISSGIGPRLDAPQDCFWESRAKLVVTAIEGALRIAPASRKSG